VQRDVLAVFDQFENERFMRIELRAPRLALPARLNHTILAPAPVPVDRRGRANREPRCRRARRHPRVNRLDYPPP